MDSIYVLFLAIPSNIFSWKRYLETCLENEELASCPELDAFGTHIPLPTCWGQKVKGLYIEFSVRSNQRFWYYKIIDTNGYFLRLETLGNEHETIWINLACPHYRGFQHLDKQALRCNELNAPFKCSEMERRKALKKLHG